MTFHRFLDELQRGGLVPGLCDKGFQHFALVIHGSLEIVHLAVDADVDLVRMPAPMVVRSHDIHPLSADLCGENRVEPVPP
jgi:hypothetical protein